MKKANQRTETDRLWVSTLIGGIGRKAPVTPVILAPSVALIICMSVTGEPPNSFVSVVSITVRYDAEYWIYIRSRNKQTPSATPTLNVNILLDQAYEYVPKASY